MRHGKTYKAPSARSQGTEEAAGLNLLLRPLLRPYLARASAVESASASQLLKEIAQRKPPGCHRSKHKESIA
jgi:hypothetical protein